MSSLFWINPQTVIGLILINVYVVHRVYEFNNDAKLEIYEYFDRPVKIVFIQCDVKLICLLICVRQHCNPEAE